MLIDTHAHLLDNKFKADLKEVMQKAAENDVMHIIEISCENNSWENALEFARKYANISCVLGIHPQEAKTATDESFKKLESVLSDTKAVGIGETGFDFYYDYSPKDIQRTVFLRHIDLANKIKKPLVIHCRDAYKELIELLNESRLENGSSKGVIHCFSGTSADAMKLVEMGFALGIDGPVTYPNAEKLREAVNNIPLESIILETDSPYLTPQKRRGQRNEPSFLPFIAEKIAEIKNISLKTVEETTSKNAKRIFNI